MHKDARTEDGWSTLTGKIGPHRLAHPEKRFSIEGEIPVQLAPCGIRAGLRPAIIYHSLGEAGVSEAGPVVIPVKTDFSHRSKATE
jgi:hypothetical protein